MIFKFLDMIISQGCSFKTKFHIYCPGCGGTRALKALLQFHPIKSLYYNPIVIILIITIIILVILKTREKRYNKSVYKIRKRVLNSFLVTWLIYFIFRNILLIYFGIDFLGDFI